MCEQKYILQSKIQLNISFFFSSLFLVCFNLFPIISFVLPLSYHNILIYSIHYLQIRFPDYLNVHINEVKSNVHWIEYVESKHRKQNKTKQYKLTIEYFKITFIECIQLEYLFLLTNTWYKALTNSSQCESMVEHFVNCFKIDFNSFWTTNKQRK
jgi:hypothetical protein